MGIFSFLGRGRGGIRNALENGAVVIDVRTANEFDRGRVQGSINIPVDRIHLNIARIKGMNVPVVLVCSSGHRSGNAAKILREAGLKEVYNGGSWEKVAKMVS
jgi:rhodanese-related sulfurtransferase